MHVLPPSIIAIFLVLLSVVGLLVVLHCVDFWRPPGQRARVDHKPTSSPLKGLARAVTNPPQAAQGHRS